MSECASYSYNPDACCGHDCFNFYSSTEDDPCWGDVEPIDEQCTDDYEDCWWIHGCQGHKDMWDWHSKAKYIPEPKETQ